ncbi:hypothetical protein [Sphingobacterium gobiense]|uniref:Uncharacterized protein n=1 Tax=Sphingobacterium gobiense TaxID=1382456 RepID=A0A2S9JUV8_9SPHI|nr:hypothetical protein [Sphingobacterium gobiense]PRD57067.1 hypothetical protein C5749_07640 [Sphingobacterium gobiense]
MSVKKSVLEQKTNTELEKYIVPESRFVPEAIRYAFEILKSRGRHFSDDEVKSIEWLIANKEEVEDNVVHENYIKASNLFLVSVGLGLINIFLAPEITAEGSTIAVSIFTLGFLLIIGLLIRKGFDWMKYVLLVFMIIGVLAIPLLLQNIMYQPVVGIINLIQTALQVVTLVILFKIPDNHSAEKQRM